MMADEHGNGNGSQADTAPAINAMVQYTKDFSFENPNAPRSLGPQEKPPNISIQVNVNARQVAETDFEVNILLEGSAGEGAESCSNSSLTTRACSGCRIFPQGHASGRHDRVSAPVVSLRAPIIAEAVRSGGFPPLYIDPIDFAALYRKRLTEAAAAAQAPVS